MKTIKFKCTLLSDIILSEQAATEGTQRTLDYIPGNVFLGVVAGQLYKEMNAETMLLFHSGKVRFGDAHPLIDNKRAIRVSGSWQVKKGESLNDQVFIYHALPETGLKDENGYPQQVKQCRNEFIVKSGGNFFTPIKQEKNFAIKSAYDKVNRRSKDQQMYGYQSLEAGTVLCFQVDFDDSDAIDLVSKVEASLKGKRNIGRSKTAQYGLIEIDKTDFETSFDETPSISSGCTFLYAESRLVFLDAFGQPTATPTGEQLGIPGASIDLVKSQIRTFRYAPYNHQRQTRDADRYGIEKGSVICINREVTDEEQKKISEGLGLYLNEGFGKVLINPEFLIWVDNLGKARFSFDKEYTGMTTTINENLNSSLPLDAMVLNYLETHKTQRDSTKIVYEKVNLFVEKNYPSFKAESFASQWGTIRSIAMKSKSPADLKNKLYNSPEGYLVHGVAKDKWSERGRFELLRSFIEKFEPKELTSEAVVNLAAEMAKKCKRK